MPKPSIRDSIERARHQRRSPKQQRHVERKKQLAAGTLAALCVLCGHEDWVHRTKGAKGPRLLWDIEAEATCPNCYDCSAAEAEDDEATA